MNFDLDFILHTILGVIVATGSLRVIRNQFFAFSFGITLYVLIRMVTLIDKHPLTKTGDELYTLISVAKISSSAGEFVVAYAFGYFLLKRLWAWDEPETKKD